MTLSDEQREVVRGLCGSGYGVAVVRAAAGTGKTFTLDAAREAWQASGHQVIGCALSARAALELEDSAGIPSVTIAAAKRGLTEGRELPHDGVLVVDEAGMVGLRNDRGLGILNGQRGTVRKIDSHHRTLTVELDGGREVTLDSGYMSDGYLDHGYALTAHKAQGATVDRTFVLGSQDLYRELGYTALSRHRDGARFYVARGDLEPNVEPDLPDYDPVVLGLEGLLKRSGAKQLALDSLADCDIAGLASERDELHTIFEHQELPSGAELVHLGWERDQAQEILNRAERHLYGLQELRDQTGLLQFRERARLDDLLTQARELRDHHRERIELASAAHDLAEGHVDDWLGKYGDQAARLVATDHVLAERQQLDEIAIARQEAVARTHDWPMRELPARELAHDVGIDLDLGP